MGCERHSRASPEEQTGYGKGARVRGVRGRKTRVLLPSPFPPHRPSGSWRSLALQRPVAGLWTGVLSGREKRRSKSGRRQGHPPPEIPPETSPNSHRADAARLASHRCRAPSQRRPPRRASELPATEAQPRQDFQPRRTAPATRRLRCFLRRDARDRMWRRLPSSPEAEKRTATEGWRRQEQDRLAQHARPRCAS